MRKSSPWSRPEGVEWRTDLYDAPIPDAGLKHIEQMKRLRRLDLTGCRGISASAKEQLKSAMPGLALRPIYESVE